MVNAKPGFESLAEEPIASTLCGGCGGCGMGRTATDRGDDTAERILSTGVRFGYMRYIGEFTHASDLIFVPGAKVVIQTKRGIEIGEHVLLTCDRCERAVSREQIRDWVGACGEDSFIFGAGRILREATAADLAEYARIQGFCRDKREFCQETADRLELPIRVVDCECPFGGERVIFYFTAEMRVDFRAMVKDLAQEFRTRIELRQVGARDEARLLADYETCGQEVCCKSFLKTLRPISMKMAKMQKATLDPSKVSGRCGRLKCCLRFENVSYEQLEAKLPRMNAQVTAPSGEGIVVARQVLTQLVQIRTDDGTVNTVGVEEIGLPVEKQPAPPARESTSQPRGNGKPDGRRPRRRSGSRGSSGSRTRSPDSQSKTKPETTSSSVSGPKVDDGKQQTDGSAEKAKARPKSRRDRRRPRRRRRGPSPGASGASEGSSGSPKEE